jgi:hypothetical protein
MAQRFYDRSIHQRKGYKTFFALSWIILFVVAIAGINFIPVALGEGFSWYIFLPTFALGIWFFRKLWLDYWKRNFSAVEAPYRTWVQLFFWSIFNVSTSWQVAMGEEKYVRKLTIYVIVLHLVVLFSLCKYTSLEIVSWSIFIEMMLVGLYVYRSVDSTIQSNLGIKLRTFKC